MARKKTHLRGTHGHVRSRRTCVEIAQQEQGTVDAAITQAFEHGERWPIAPCRRIVNESSECAGHELAVALHHVRKRRIGCQRQKSWVGQHASHTRSDLGGEVGHRPLATSQLSESLTLSLAESSHHPASWAFCWSIAQRFCALYPLGRIDIVTAEQRWTPQVDVGCAVQP